jgi:hypothetical protein
MDPISRSVTPRCLALVFLPDLVLFLPNLLFNP